MAEKTTTYQRILKTLVEAQRRGIQFKRDGELTPPGWVPADIFIHPGVGGVSALRRIRELRAKGFRIEWKYFIKRDGTPTKTTLYRLITPHQYVDIKTVSIKTKTKQQELF